jgi:hypothetical protein
MGIGLFLGIEALALVLLTGYTILMLYRMSHNSMQSEPHPPVFHYAIKEPEKYERE